jgi:mono/diheme cytochrome c family protein
MINRYKKLHVTFGWLMATHAVMGSASFALASPPAHVADAAARQFEREVRPALLANCATCHGKQNPAGGLRLDVPVPAEKAPEIVKRLKGEDGAAKMPPSGTLPGNSREVLISWAAGGAHWPSAAKPVDAHAAQKHWAFQPIRRAAVPPVKAQWWVRNPIDAFILSGLEKHGLQPSPAASRRDLIRRLTYDLTGLPPTPEEVAAFAADKAPNAYEKLADRLLDSPHYGERWGRRWLDVVRYAETNSYERDNPKPNVYKFRDYVIRSLNEDKPFSRFVQEQIAGDEIGGGAGDALIGTGYYRLGIWDDEPADLKQAEFDDLDDLVTTTGQAFLGLTLDCARCHDHKFDPIPQKDYYRMAAVFRNINRFKNGGATDEMTLFTTAAEKQEYERKVADLEAKRKAAGAQLTAIEAEYKKTRDRLIQPTDFAALRFRYYEGAFNSMPNFDALKPTTQGDLKPSFITLKPRRRDENFGFVFEGAFQIPKEGDYTFYIDSDDGSRLIVAGKKLTEKAGGGQGAEQSGTIHLPAGTAPFRIDYFQGASLFGLNVSWSGPGFARRPLSPLADSSTLGLPTLLKAELAQIAGKERAELYNRINAEKVNLDKLDVPQMKVLCVTEAGPKAPDTFLLKRGNPLTPGDKVTAGFPECLGGGDTVDAPMPEGSKTCGRRTQLANWLISAQNPLTARVIVNRIWQGHFGRGIVKTPNDFGLQGARPTHPELLDWLATEFVKQGWSMKKLHRLIVTSNAYKQSSRANARGLAKDPVNDLFWRFDMRRLEAEEIRDSMLAVSGALNTEMYGEPVYPDIPKDILAAQSIPGNDWYTDRMKPEQKNRRSIYVHAKRSLIYPLFASFDMPDPDRTSAMRFASVQPTQALGLLNGPFATAQAAQMAARVRAETRGKPDADYVARVFALAMQRMPTVTEIGEGLKLLSKLKAKGATPEKAQEYLCLTALNLNEFFYLD